MKPFENQTVIVPFDFSEASRRAIDQVLEWSDSSTSIHVIFAVEPTLTLISYDTAMPLPPSFDMDTRDRVLENLNEMFGKGKYKQLGRHCKIGDPGSEIVALADSLQANVIVMPSHGRTGLSRLFLGSVAERVLRFAPCPVLILRGDAFSHESVKDKRESNKGDAVLTSDGPCDS